MAALSINDQIKVRALQRSDVESAVSSLAPYLENARWIADTNSYRTDTARRLKRHAPNSALNQRELTDYVAASAVLHANDGWSYLGCALSALLQGDPHRAIHLAYYSELRAALSLLASEGIGVFNNTHYVLGPNSTVSKLDHSHGTHAATWDILSFWSSEPSSGTLFANIVKPEGQTLDSWFQPYGGVSAIAAQARSWFDLWGMDLQLAQKDQVARNESSYAPGGVNTSATLDPADSVKFVSSLWHSLKPSPGSSFAEIDRHILRLSLENSFLGRNGIRASATDHKYLRFVRTIIENQGFSGRSFDILFSFLVRQTDPNNPLIFSYSSNFNTNNNSDVFGILSRATLLLRVATGSARNLFLQAGLTLDNVDFWVQQIGVSRGLWDTGDETPDLQDLWTDVGDVLSELDSFHLRSLRDFIHNFGGRLPLLSGSERVSLWSLYA